jgi:hypothetical protein
VGAPWIAVIRTKQCGDRPSAAVAVVIRTSNASGTTSTDSLQTRRVFQRLALPSVRLPGSISSLILQQLDLLSHESDVVEDLDR